MAYNPFDTNPYSAIKANSTLVPGLGYIPNSSLQSDSRGQWIGAGPGMTSPTGDAGMTSDPNAGYDMPSNPYLGGQAQDITNRTNDWLGSALAGIQGNAVGVGGLGGTRQGVAQAGAITKGADMLSGNLAGLYGNNWNQQQNRDLSRYGLDQNFYTAQRGQDQSGAALGANLYNLGVQGQWSPYQNFGNTMGPFTGFGNTTTSGQQGGGWQGAIGGGLGLGQYGWDRGWWGNTPTGK